MKKVSVILIAVVALALFVVDLGTTQAQGQDVVTAQIDRTAITTDESLRLTVSIDDAAGKATQIIMPPLDAFQVLGSSSGQQISIVNGRTSRHSTYQYQLQPMQTGQLTIGTISIEINGGLYTTAPIVITVTQGTGVTQQPTSPFSGGQTGSSSLSQLLSQLGNMGGLSSFFSAPSSQGAAAPPATNSIAIEPAAVPAELIGQDYFLEATVDKTNPYQGQQLTYTMRFYQAVNSGGLEYQPPTFTGFWSEQLPEQGEYTIQAGGRNYRVTTLWTILFPTSVGETTIDPATLNVAADFFSRGGKLQTAPVPVNVQALPDPAPADFRGAVGRFDITASTDKATSKVNDTVTWQVTVSGAGNIDSLPDPVWPESPEWRAFDSDAAVESGVEDDFMAGSRRYERVLVPTAAGKLTLPALNYTYFDPYSGEYATASSEAIEIFVEADNGGTTFPDITPATSNNAGLAPGAGIGPDIRPVKDTPASWNQGGRPITQSSAFWLLWTVPLFLLSGQFAWQRWHTSRENNVEKRRSQQAAGKARQALRKAAQEPATRHEAAGHILNGYLADKLNQSISGLTQSELAGLLYAAGLGSELIETTLRVQSVSEMGRFAPGADDFASGDILKSTEEVINQLEKGFV
jgi:hypothetical protein